MYRTHGVPAIAAQRWALVKGEFRQTRANVRGFTLIEAIISLVILAAAAAGVLLVYAQTTAGSADPALRAQAQAIAVAYMDEILLQSYADPDSGATGGTEEGSRSDYDDVWDYDAINGETPTDRTNNTITALSDYSVSVSVVNSGIASPNASPARITVTVVHNSGRVDYDLVSQREDY